MPAPAPTPARDVNRLEPDVLDGSMTPSDLVFALEHLHFGRNRNALGALRIDRQVRDFLVAALRRNGLACSR
jgi:hypothetical protein